MLLLIDNYDSFVHNLARYFERLGQETVVARNDAINIDEARALEPEAIVISPGPCTPSESGISREIVRTLGQDLPLLGVCLGHQVIAEVCGAVVVRAATPIHGQTSRIRHNGEGLFADLPSPLEVGRYHSLVVEAKLSATELRPTAWTRDGVLMAFEHLRLPWYGVQFHPESILTARGYDILANFLRLARLKCSERPHEFGKAELARADDRHPPLPTNPITF